MSNLGLLAIVSADDAFENSGNESESLRMRAELHCCLNLNGNGQLEERNLMRRKRRRRRKTAKRERQERMMDELGLQMFEERINLSRREAPRSRSRSRGEAEGEGRELEREKQRQSNHNFSAHNWFASKSSRALTSRNIIYNFSSLILILVAPRWVSAKGLVGKLPGNPASCQEEPCTSDPQHVLYALKWTSLGFGLILLLPLLMYYLSKLISKIKALCSGANSASPSSSSHPDGGDNKDSLRALDSQAKVPVRKRKSTVGQADGLDQVADQRASQTESAEMARKTSACLAAAIDALQLNGNEKLNRDLAEQSRQLAQLIADSNVVIQQQHQRQLDEQQNELGKHRYSFAMQTQQHHQQPQLSHLHPSEGNHRRSLRAAGSSRRLTTKVHPTGASEALDDCDLEAALASKQQQQQQQQQQDEQWISDTSAGPARAARSVSMLPQSDANQFDANQVSLVSHLYRQQQQQDNAEDQIQQQRLQLQLQQPYAGLAPPSNGAQHRHSIDGSVLNKMAHSMQQGREQLSCLSGSCDTRPAAQQQQLELELGNQLGLGARGRRGSRATKRRSGQTPNKDPIDRRSPMQYQQQQQHRAQLADQQQQQQQQQPYLLTGRELSSRRPSLNAAVMQQQRQHL